MPSCRRSSERSTKSFSVGGAGQFGQRLQGMPAPLEASLLVLAQVLDCPGAGFGGLRGRSLGVVPGKPQPTFGIVRENRRRGELLLDEELDILGNEAVGR